jgi:hypothetical protein
VNEYFFIERENMPCIYELGVDSSEFASAIIVKVNREFVESFAIPVDSPIVEHFKREFGFVEFCPILGDNGFGFEYAFTRDSANDHKEFIAFRVNAPIVRRPAMELCPACRGIQPRTLFGNDPCRRCDGSQKIKKQCQRCVEFDDVDAERCIECNGRGFEMIYDWHAAYAISASFTSFFEFANLWRDKSKATRCLFPQLIWVNTMTARRQHGGSLDGTYSIPLVKWLASFLENTEIPEMSNAMRVVYGKMFGEEDFYDKYEIWAKIAYKNGWLNVSCPGDACGLHPQNSMGPRIGEGYEFGCHNVDTPMQQFTLLAGLGALCRRYEKDVGRI